MPAEHEVARGPRVLKIIRLESYEDTLSNLRVSGPVAIQTTMDESPDVREDYLIHYSLNFEARDSASLVDVTAFMNPFDYRLAITESGETRSTRVDLVETFNWLLGLRVQRLRSLEGFRTVEGLNPDGERVLVIWRQFTGSLSDDQLLKKFFIREGYEVHDQERPLRHVYVNGDSTLATLKGAQDVWDVLLIEEWFKRLMFRESEGGLL